MARHRNLVLAALAGIALVVTVPATAAHALPVCKVGYQCVYLYYSNVQYTTQVGSTYIYCNGTASTIGEVTGYIRVEESLCG